MTEAIFSVATREDMEAFYGKPMTRSFVAIKGEVDGEVRGIGGAMWDGYWYAFMDVREDYSARPREFVVGVRRAMELLDKRALRLVATPEREESIGFLEHFNFSAIAPGVYERRNC